MRYLISNSFVSTTTARQKYIFDSMHLWTKIYPAENGFVTLESIPTCSLDVLFIVGHDSEVENYLKKQLSTIYEKNIVIITCGKNIKLSTLAQTQKTLYFTR